MLRRSTHERILSEMQASLDAALAMLASTRGALEESRRDFKLLSGPDLIIPSLPALTEEQIEEALDQAREIRAALLAGEGVGVWPRS